MKWTPITRHNKVDDCIKDIWTIHRIQQLFIWLTLFPLIMGMGWLMTGSF